MDKLRVIARRELLRIASLNSVGVGLKILTGLAVSKVIAVLIGPAGLALTGNLRNFLTSVETAATLGFQNGIVRYVAEADTEARLSSLLSTVVRALLISTGLISAFLFFGADWLSAEVFGPANGFGYIFRALALGLPWYVGSMFIVSVLNGLGKFRGVIHINMIGNVLSLLVSLSLIYRFGIEGALLATVLAPALVFFVTVFFIRGNFTFKKVFSGPVDISLLKNLSEYSLMALFSAVVAPLVLLAIRNRVIGELGIREAGLWDGLLRISSYYMLFLSTILAVYFLPSLAKARSRQATKQVFVNYFQWMLPPFLFGLILLYFAKDLVIRLLFSVEFEAMSPLFVWQLAGDFFRAASLVLGYAFFARKLTRAFIVTEVFSLAVLWSSSTYLIGRFGVEGAVMAHALTYLVYLVVLILYFRRTLFSAPGGDVL